MAYETLGENVRILIVMLVDCTSDDYIKYIFADILFMMFSDLTDFTPWSLVIYDAGLVTWLASRHDVQFAMLV